jgi:hypothetical protein
VSFEDLEGALANPLGQGAYLLEDRSGPTFLFINFFNGNTRPSPPAGSSGISSPPSA